MSWAVRICVLSLSGRANLVWASLNFSRLILSLSLETLREEEAAEIQATFGHVTIAIT